MFIVYSKLVAGITDIQGYTTYVFEILDHDDVRRLDTKYVMCVKFPNWESSPIKLEEAGYLSFREIEAGKDTWFNGTSFVKYNYDMVQFLNFVRKPDKVEDTCIL